MMQFRNTFAHTTLEIGPLRYVTPQKSVVESLSQNIYHLVVPTFRVASGGQGFIFTQSVV